MEALRSFLNLSVVPNKSSSLEDFRRRMINQRILLVATIVLLFFMTLSLILGTPAGTSLVISIVGLLIVLCGLILSRFGYSRIIGFLIPGLFWGLVTFLIFQHGGMFTPVSGAYILIVLFAGFSISPRAGYIFALMSSIVYFAVFILAREGLITAQEISFEQIWIAETIFMIGSAAIVYVNVNTIEAALKQAEFQQDALQANMRRYSALFEHSNDGVFLIDLDGILRSTNQRGAEMLGYDVDELIGQHYSLNIAEDQFADAENKTEAALSGKDVQVYERIFIKKDGTRVPAEINLTMVYDEAGNPQNYQTIVRDISERKKDRAKLEDLLLQVNHARDSLSIMSKKLVEVQESERRFLARELHDEIGQTLTGLKIILDTIATPSENELGKKQRAVSLVNELLARVRELSLDLRPPMLDDFGLVPALEWMITNYEQQTGIMVYFIHEQFPEEKRFSFEIETGLFRIIQEALNNVARHARVNLVKVEIEESDSVIRAVVIDNGIGFDLSKKLSSASLSNGIMGMKERLGLIGGKVHIQTAPGEGTTVTASVDPDKELLQ